MSGSDRSEEYEGTPAELGVLRPGHMFFISTYFAPASYASAAALTQQQRDFLVVCNDYVTTVFTDNYREDRSLYQALYWRVAKLIAL